MYDAAAEAVPMAQSGRNRKKAVVIISDGNDTSSRVGVSEVKRVVRETEVLVYAVGIDGNAEPTFRGAADAADSAAAAHSDSVSVPRSEDAAVARLHRRDIRLAAAQAGGVFRATPAIA